MIKFVALITDYNRFSEEYCGKPYSIQKIEIKKETAKMVYYQGCKYNKTGIIYDIYKVCDTEKEALTYLKIRLAEEKERLEQLTRDTDAKWSEIQTKISELRSGV